MKRIRCGAMILVLSLAMNGAFLAVTGYDYYQNRSRPHSVADHFSGKNHHFYEMLGLTPAQLKKMRPMAAAFHERLNRLHADMGDKKDDLIRLLGADNVARDRIEERRVEMAAIQSDIEKAVIAHVLDVREILDAGQQKRFFDLLRKRMDQKPGIFTGTGEK